VIELFLSFLHAREKKDGGQLVTIINGITTTGFFSLSFVQNCLVLVGECYSPQILILNANNLNIGGQDLKVVTVLLRVDADSGFEMAVRTFHNN
jgi:hypothetical protein